MRNIVIDIAAEFTGRKSFAQASKSTTVLERSVKKLGKAFVGVFAAQKLLQFGTSAAKAFAADEAAAQRLTTAVGNLGLGFQDLRIKQFINSLEATSGVLDDKLRPAMQALLLQTGSVAKSQELLRLSIDTAAGSGQDLITVANDIAQAYVGNTRGLRKYYLGLTQAELKTTSFVDIQEKLNKQFSGANAYYLTTYAGQMSQLNVAADNAKETIGKGLVDALTILGGNNDIKTIADLMEKTAKNAASFVTNIALGFRRLKDIVTLNIKDLKEVQRLYDKLNAPPQQFGGVFADQYRTTAAKAAAAAEKVIADRIKADKLSAANKIKADKLAASNKLKLDKASSIFDLQKISIAAALKGKISEEEKTRLLLMQAIADEDANKAEALSKKLEEIQKKNAEITKSLTEITAATNPFEAWVASLGAAGALLAGLGSKYTGTGMPELFKPDGTLTPRGKRNIPTEPDLPSVDATMPVPTTSIFGTNDTIDQIIVKVENAALAAAQAADEAAQSVKETQTVIETLAAVITNGSTTSFSGSSGFGWSVPQGMGSSIPQTPTIIVNNNGTTIMQDEFIAAISDAILESQRFGYGRTPAGALL